MCSQGEQEGTDLKISALSSPLAKQEKTGKWEQKGKRPIMALLLRTMNDLASKVIYIFDPVRRQ
jgi:hypothetical protein